MKAGRVAVVFAASCFACGLSIVGTEGAGPAGADGGVLPDGAPKGDGASGGSIDGAAPPGAAVQIAPAGTATMPSGQAQQTHLIYAENTHRWWLFTISSDAPSVLQAWTSPEFGAWTRAQDLALPQAHRGLGANFTVAYASPNGHDVVHLGIGLGAPGSDHSHFHARAELVGASLTWGTLTSIATVNKAAIDPEAPATYISPGGSIVDFTSWAPYIDVQDLTGAECAYTSTAVDTGTAWTFGFGAREDIVVRDKQITARAAIALGGEDVLGMWESADNEPPTNVQSARRIGGEWKAAINVFPAQSFNVNDWGAATVVPNEVHAIRHANAFEHARYKNGDQSWSPGDAMPTLDMKVGSGVVVLHDTSRIAVFAIGNDNAIDATSWSNGRWASWKVVVPARGTRTALSGWWSKTAGFALIWTDANAVFGSRVSLD